MGLTPPASNPTVLPSTQSTGDFSQAAIDAQKPLIDAQVESQTADTALKQQALASSKYDLQRKMGQRFQHRISRGAIKSAPASNPNALSERRIGADGKAIVSTPRLDAAGMTTPVSSVDSMGNAVNTPTNPNAASVAQIRSPGLRPVSIRPQVRPKKVTQSAIVNPRVNPLFKQTAVA